MSIKTFYAINLNGKYAGKSRWALYEIVNHGMDVVWPKRKDEKDITKRDLLPNQVFCNLKQYPAYHFVSNGYGLSHIGEIAYNLAQHFKEDIEIFELHGHSPSLHTASFRPVVLNSKVKESK